MKTRLSHDLNHFLAFVPALFPIIESVGCFSIDTSNSLTSRASEGEELVCCFGMSEGVIALTFGSSLFLANRSFSPQDQNAIAEVDIREFASVQAEIEFEHKLSNISWDNFDNCLAVYDSGGTVHLLKIDGSIAFSKKILPDPELVMFSFVTLSACTQALFSLTTSGQLLCVSNMDTAALCGNNGDEKIQALKSLQLLKWTVSTKLSAPLSKASLLRVGSEGVEILLAVIDTKGKLSLMELVADGSCTVKDLGCPHALGDKQVVDIRCLLGKISFVLTSDGTLFVLSCHLGTASKVLEAFYIGDSSLTFQYVDSIDGSIGHTEGFLVSVSSKTRVYSFTVINTTDLDVTYIIPHGYSLLSKHGEGSVDYVLRSQNSSTADCRGLCLHTLESRLTNVSVQQFSRVSKMLARDICRSALSTTSLDQLYHMLVDTKSLPFGVLLGCLAGCILRLPDDGELDTNKVEGILLRILDQRFAPEILLAGITCLPLLLRAGNVTTYFTRFQAAVSVQKMAKEGLTESYSILSRLIHYSYLCSSKLFFSPSILLDSDSEYLHPLYGNVIERLHAVLPARIGFTVSRLLLTDYSHYSDIVVLIQHQVASIYCPVVLDGGNIDISQHAKSSLMHLLQQATISNFFADVDPRAIVDVSSFLFVCDYILEAYKQTTQEQLNCKDDVASGITVELCRLLHDFAKCIADDLNKDSTCKVIVHHALSALQQLPAYYKPHVVNNLRIDLESFSEHLSLQSALHKVLKVRVSIENIQSVGWRGFIFEQLEAFNIVTEDGTALCNDVLSGFIGSQLEVLTAKFSVDLDSILSEYIVCTFDQLLSEMAMQEDGGHIVPIHECHATLAKLLVVFKNIRQPALFGYTCLVKMFAFYSYLHNNESIPLNKVAEVALCENFCDGMMSTLAEEYIAVSKGKERDEVSEALRLYRLRLMARKYAIHDIDLRDNHQLLAALSIITNHGVLNGDNNLPAGMQFAVQDSNVRVDISSALTRRLVSFASSTPHDDLAYDHKLHAFLICVPAKIMHTVLEDVLDCLRAEHDDFCSQLKLIGKSVLESGEAQELKTLADNTAKGIVKFSEAYCDGDYTTPGSTQLLSWRERDVKSKSTSQLQHTTHRDIFKVMSNYRKLYHLQTAHHIYMVNSDLGSAETCLSFIRNMALASVDKFLSSLDQIKHQYPGSSPYYVSQDSATAPDTNLLIGDYMCTEIPRLGKIANILAVGLAKVVLIVTRRMLEKNKKALAFCFANNYLDAAKEQDENLSNEESSLSLTKAHGNNDESITFVEEDWQALVDIVKILSSASLKKTSSGSLYGSSYYDTTSTDTTADELTDTQVMRIHVLSQQTLSRAAVCAPSKVLQKSIELLSMQDLLSSTYSQLEESKTRQDSSVKTSFKLLFHLEDSVLDHDGLLLSQEQTLPLLAQYVLSETRRREHFLSISSGKLPAFPDLVDLVTFLQRSEKHLMAMKILYGTWQPSSDIGKLSKMIKASAFSLCHKVLHYRTLDNSFALACLSSLPLEITIKELKAAVPSTLSTDFYRLQSIATLGEEMATLHENDSMLLLFQRLTNHAKWWGILSNTLHISVDVKLFQHADFDLQNKYIKSLVSSIVFMSKGNLDMASEYCQVFDIEPECSLLAYIEYMLSSSTGHENWEYKVKQAALGLKEEDLVRELSRILFKLSGTDYERIIFVCQWLVTLLSDADDNSHNAEFLTKYKNYVDISKYLTNLDVPLSVFDALQSGKLATDAGLKKGEHTNHRLSFWSLVNHTLDFIDLLCSASVTWTLDKIAPLVRYIDITMEDFYLSLICGFYPSLRPEPMSKIIDSVSSSSVCADIVTKVEERMSTYLLLAPQHFIHVYMFISEFEERSSTFASFAREMRIFVIKRTVSIMEKTGIESWVLSRGAGKQNHIYNKSSLITMLLNLEVESIITAFSQSLPKFRKLQDRWWEQAPYVGENGEVVLLPIAERLIEACIETSWEEHASRHTLLGACKTMSLYTMLKSHSVSNDVLGMLATTAKYVLEVMSLSSLATAQSVETLVLTMVYKLLADSSSLPSNMQDSLPSGVMLKSDMLYHLLPSSIENQQSDVVFTGFGLFTVLTICKQISSSGLTALTIHDSLCAEFVKVALEDKDGSLGFRNISARRFNARCRCKVSLALALVKRNQSQESFVHISHVDSTTVQRHVSYYCILASMQETRNITYSEESFYTAFHAYDHTTLRSILLTWIYCEGGESRPDSVSSVVDILSLSVDLYVLASLFKVTAISLFTELLERLVSNKGSERLILRLLSYMCYHQTSVFNQAVYQCSPHLYPVFTKASAGLVVSMNTLADRLSKELQSVFDGQATRSNNDINIFTRPSEAIKSALGSQKLLRHVDSVMFPPLAVSLSVQQAATTWRSLLSLLSFLNLNSPLGMLAPSGVDLQESVSAALRVYIEAVVIRLLRMARLEASVLADEHMPSLIKLTLSNEVIALCVHHQATMDTLLLECWQLVAATHVKVPVVASSVIAHLMRQMVKDCTRPGAAAESESVVVSACLRTLAALPSEFSIDFVSAVLRYLLVEIPSTAIAVVGLDDCQMEERARLFCTKCLYQALQSGESPLAVALKDFVRRELSEEQRKKLWSSLRH